jgi:hypothetical protein
MTVAIALTFSWLGLVTGLSFIEAPLKFRAPGMTRELGLGIGRLVFKALNGAELVLAAGILLMLIGDEVPALAWALFAVVAGILVIQTGMLHLVMDRRAARIVQGESLPPSRQHLLYIGGEVAKLALLVALGTVLLQEVTA